MRLTPSLLDSRVKCGNEARETGSRWEVADEDCFWSRAAAPVLWRGPRQNGERSLRSPGMAKQHGGGGSGEGRVTWMVGAGEAGGVVPTGDPVRCALCPQQLWDAAGALAELLAESLGDVWKDAQVPSLAHC